MDNAKFSPKEFLKNRRPEKFSDSIIIEKNILDRPVLEHHLATLNKRNQELAFEDYAKRICEKVVCPNLLAQTGPVAGGDGKVDTQTFPVSEQNQIMWYEGVNDTSQKERWAFAVSTNEAWKAKCRKDIIKIKETERGYVQAFFVTNQYCKSNQRSALEDKLKTETGMNVQILDISWLLDQTFKHGLEDIAIETLSPTTVYTASPKLGHNDYRKSNELEIVLGKINNEVNPQAISVHQVDMFLEAAILSKELEKGELETQGLFDRAVRVANKFGTNQQKFSVFYEYAWASHWWFEDFSLFVTNFEKAFECVSDSLNSSKLENFVTLVNVFQGHLHLTEAEFSIDFESIKLKTKQQLRRISHDDVRPSSSLQARTSLELLDLIDIESIDDAKRVLNNLLVIAKECERLVGYSFDLLFDSVSAMDMAFGDMEEYETLLDYLTEQSSVRYGETQSSLILLKRGVKRLESGKPYQTIKLVGKSLLGLYKHESRRDIVVALSVMSCAYEKIGLLWAARGSLLLAASLITDEFWRSDEISPAQADVYLKLAWLESRLGRISHALTWLEMAIVINQNLKDSKFDDDEIIRFDGYLSHCILRAGINIINSLEKLPDLLDQLGLYNSRALLLYCLGYEKLVAEEIHEDVDERFVDYLVMVRDHDFGIKAAEINTFTGRLSEITSSVLGCRVSISFLLRSPFVELAESILSVIEGFCSTGIVDNVYAIEPDLRIEISTDDDESIAISHEIDDSSGVLIFDVMCSAFTPDMLNIDGQIEIQEWLQKFIIDVYARMVVPNHAEENIKSLLYDDRAIERSISFGACFTTLHNVLGHNAIKDISMLLESHEGKAYQINRRNTWDQDFPIKYPVISHSGDYKAGVGEPPENLTKTEDVSHLEISTHGLIKNRLWDKAKWNGTVFIMYPDSIPILSLMFEDETAANNVFTNLLTEVGAYDHLNKLRVSVIRKISTEDPFNYRVSVTENMRLGETKFVTTISRSNTMTPSTDENLNNFLLAYREAGSYRLNYCTQRDGRIISPVNFDKVTILKKDLIIKDAWEVGRNDLECMAIKKRDTPITPTHIKSPPVAEVLRRLNRKS